jgi:GNAT superfamily N-acetyltransferase
MGPVTITYLEMLSLTALRPRDFPDPHVWVKEAVVKEWRFNRFLYTLVGADWSWTDKLSWTEQQWRDYAEVENLRTFVAYHEGAVLGYFELRRDGVSDIEIAIFGIAPKFTGRGYGGALLSHALRAAWQMSPGRVWLHTCTLDHPAALPNYLARGMTIYRVETSPAPGAKRFQD